MRQKLFLSLALLVLAVPVTAQTVKLPPGYPVPQIEQTLPPPPGMPDLDTYFAFPPKVHELTVDAINPEKNVLVRKLIDANLCVEDTSCTFLAYVVLMQNKNSPDADTRVLWYVYVNERGRLEGLGLGRHAASRFWQVRDGAWVETVRGDPQYPVEAGFFRATWYYFGIYRQKLGSPASRRGPFLTYFLYYGIKGPEVPVHNSTSGLTEPCVNCLRDTGIPVRRSVDRRQHYLEGAGQLCRDCHHGLFPGDCKCPQPDTDVPTPRPWIM